MSTVTRVQHRTYIGYVSVLELVRVPAPVLILLLTVFLVLGLESG